MSASQKRAWSPRLDVTIPSTRANGLITDIAIWFLLGGDPWLPVATWVTLLGDLDVPAPTARTALSRMTKGGFLSRESRRGRAGYAMSDDWVVLMQEAGPPAYARTSQGAQWALLTFSVPEAERATRHTLRTILDRLGFAPFGNGVWVAPGHRLEDARAHIDAAGLSHYVDLFHASYEGFGDPVSFTRRCWDIDAIANAYLQLEDESTRRLERAPAADSTTFAGVVLASTTQRRINSLDPGLPLAALPDGWPRDRAIERCDEQIQRDVPLARQYVRDVSER